MKNVSLTCILTSIVFASFSQNFGNQTKVVPGDRTQGDYFGHSLDISGNYAIVGALHESEDDFGNNTLTDAGSAYVFKRDEAGQWSQVAKLVASDRDVQDFFGYSVAIASSNGKNYAVVGARYEDEDENGSNTLAGAGSAYVFEEDNNGNWVEVQKIVASDREASDRFGWSVAMAGNMLVVGARQESEDENGNNTLSQSGSAYIFERDNNGFWLQTQKIVASDRNTTDWYGHAVDIATSGADSYIIVGAFREDEDTAGTNTMEKSGSAYIYKKQTNGTWLEMQKITASDRAMEDAFGYAVSIATDGVSAYAIAGAHNEDEDAQGNNTANDAGSAYVFEFDGNNWNQAAKLAHSDREDTDWFGSSVAVGVEGALGYAIIGAFFEDHDLNGNSPLSNAGSAYMFERDGSGNWNEIKKVVANQRKDNDYFASAVAISVTDTGIWASAGAYLEDEDEEEEFSKSQAGSVYFFGGKCSIDTSVTQTGTTLTADEDMPGTTYQWYNCDAAAIITGETNQTFEATANGNYAVIITNGICSDTSGCQSVTSVGVGQLQTAQVFQLFPNPNNGNFFIKTLAQRIEGVRLYNTQGKLVREWQNVKPGTTMSFTNMESGTYFLQAITAKTVSTQRVIVRH